MEGYIAASAWCWANEDFSFEPMLPIRMDAFMEGI